MIPTLYAERGKTDLLKKFHYNFKFVVSYSTLLTFHHTQYCHLLLEFKFKCLYTHIFPFIKCWSHKSLNNYHLHCTDIIYYHGN